MAIVAASPTLWDALAGRPPDRPLAPADPGLWAMVQERLNPARARPVARAGIEQVMLESVRGVAYVMVRSPDREAAYVRLTPQEAELTRLMDGSRTVAELIRSFLAISGTLAPRQVVRVVADLAGGRMLEELPVDAFASVSRARRRPVPVRIGQGLVAAARGKRMVLGDPDRLVGFLYRFGGRFLFARPAAVVMAAVGLGGFGVFVHTWIGGGRSAFVSSGSYAVGALVLLGLNAVALAAHELGHALAAKHAGRRVTAAGALLYFGIPSVFVDTTDVWMSDRRDRLRTTAAGPIAALTLAGLGSLVGLAFPPLAPLLFKLSLAWYINSLFNLNPFMALDGYYLLMDWLEMPNLRPRSVAFIVTVVRRRRAAFAALDREGLLVAGYAALTVLWTLVSINLAVRMYRDRVSGLVAGVWHRGLPGRLLLVTVVGGLLSPVVYALAGMLSRGAGRVLARARAARDNRDVPRREAALRASELHATDQGELTSLALASRWVRPVSGGDVLVAGSTVDAAYLVVEGVLESRRRGDPTASVRERVGPGRVVALAPACTGAPSPLTWRAVDALLLAVPGQALAALSGPLGLDAAPVEWEEANEALVLAPALAGLADDDRRALVPLMVAHDLGPETDVRPDGASNMSLVGRGVVVDIEGHNRGRGDLFASGRTRSAARVWHLPRLLDPAMVAGAAADGSATPGQPPARGVHGSGWYPPVTPGSGVPGPSDGDADRRLLQRLAAMLALLLVLFILTGAIALLPSRAWAEIPPATALVVVRTGIVDAVVDGDAHRLHRGDRIVISTGDAVAVGRRSSADLIFRGGSAALLCPSVDLSVVRIAPENAGAGPLVQLRLDRGRLVAATASASPTIGPAELAITVGRHLTANVGEARYAVDRGAVAVAAGEVTDDGRPVAPVDRPLGCGARLASAGATEPGPAPTSTSNSTSTSPSLTTVLAEVSTTLASLPTGSGEPTTTAPRPGPTTTTPRPTTTVPPATTAPPTTATSTTVKPTTTTTTIKPTTTTTTIKPTTTTTTIKPTTTTCPVVGC